MQTSERLRVQVKPFLWAKEMITQEELKVALIYDCEDGSFRWREYRSSMAKKGDIAGVKTSHGYVKIKINKTITMRLLMKIPASILNMGIKQILKKKML